MNRKRILMIWHHYDHQIHLGIAKYAHKANWILDSHHRLGGIPGNLDYDGILSCHGDNDDIVDYIKRKSTPAVDMGWHNRKIRIPQVTVDSEAVGKMGAEYFISKGFRNVAFVLMNENPTVPEYRCFKSFKEAISKEEGMTFTKIDFWPPSETVKTLSFPLGIMCLADKRAVFLLDEFLDSGYRIPEEIAVLGVDNNMFIGEFASVPLSSIDPNLFGNGYMAAELLAKMMNGTEVPAETVFVPPVGVVERRSTDIFAVNHSNVSKALKEIHSCYKEKLSIDQIAVKSGMSRRRLDDAFKKHLGHSIFDELTKVRLDNAKKLLLETDLKIEAIVCEAGFSNIRHLDDTFIRIEKTTPSAFRKRFRK